ncbi:MAG TPA: response regulator transcription factor [Steroidobacteraceae bacterium]|nr:response regulator transcription factor [Steroidobacteraceae bacterium]
MNTRVKTPAPGTASGALRVLLVDDHAIVREGLRALLEEDARISIVAEASNGNEATEMAARLTPDLVLMDLKMPGLPAADAIRVIRARSPSTHVLVLTSYVDDEQVQAVLSAGALGYVLKDVAKSELLRAMQTVARGEPWLHAEAQRLIVNRLRRPAQLDPLELLTERERSVLKLIAPGRSNKDISRTLSLTEGTVKGYVSNILAKLKLEDRTQAALLAVRHGLDQ